MLVPESFLADYSAMLGDRVRALDFLDRSLAGKEKDKDLLFRAALVSIGGRSLTTPVFSFEPKSAVAENWPLVSP